MNINDQTLAKKYAEAFFNLYANSIDLQGYDAIKNAAQFLKNNRDLIVHFKLPQMRDEKLEVLKKFFEYFSIPSSVKKLAFLLLEHKRLFLLPEVFLALQKAYCKKKNVIEFEVSTSHQLTKDQLEFIKYFLEKKTGATILYNEVLNKSLIAGIRLLSTNYLWEYSIAQQLRDAQQALLS